MDWVFLDDLFGFGCWHLPHLDGFSFREDIVEVFVHLSVVVVQVGANVVHFLVVEVLVEAKVVWLKDEAPVFQRLDEYDLQRKVLLVLFIVGYG